MNNRRLVINAHYKGQPVTGVQRYAIEILDQFNRLGVSYRPVEPPGRLNSQIARQLWMQAFMPGKISDGELLWSPTNMGPVACSRQVVTLHDISDQLFPHWFSRKYVTWRKVMLPGLLSRVSGIITVSEFSKKTIIERYPQAEEKIRVIPNGINRDQFYPRPEPEQEKAARKFGLEKPFAVTVSSLDPRKNIGGLIKTWHTLPESVRREMDLVIIGEKADIFTFELDDEIDSSVRFLGYVDHDHLPQLYSLARFFVYPSLFEGFGLPVLEAMACRTPVITSNTTSLKELAAGRAITVDPADSEALAAAILEMAESEAVRTRYAEEGYRYAKTFSWQSAARETLAFLDQNGI